MDDDRALLEAAARAAGYAVVGWDGACADCPIVEGDRLGSGHKVRWYWMPLHDDGDALRLAHALNFSVAFYVDHTEVIDTIRKQSWIEPDTTLEAARRAIVRAAAFLAAAGSTGAGGGADAPPL